ncbi:MAG: peptidylprolyl isomerase [Jatrophihabitans sp.]
MSTNKQRREAARRKLERQLQARVARERRRKRTLTVLTAVGIVVVVAVVSAFIAVSNNGGKKKNKAGSSSSSSGVAALPSRPPAKITRTTPKSTTGPCKYKETAAGLKSGNLFDVGLPPDPKTTPTATRTATFTTNQGVITVDLDGKNAPCNVQSIVYLIGKKFYDNTACPRSVNSGIFVVQCGDPSGTTGGGPTYTVKDESLKTAKYPAGVLAMANSGANTNGSQFFFITKDSTSGLGSPGKYTVIGKITKGLDIVQKIAAGGDDESNQAGGGRPNIDLIFKTVTVK